MANNHAAHLIAFDNLRRSIAALDKVPEEEREKAILDATKEAFSHFDVSAEGTKLLVDEVLAACQAPTCEGIKTYDELNALYFFVAELIGWGERAVASGGAPSLKQQLEREVATLTEIREAIFDSRKGTNPEWQNATEIYMRTDERGSRKTSSQLLHDYVNRSIDSLGKYNKVADMLQKVFGDRDAMPALRASISSVAPKTTVTVITDPRTDPNEDDLAALATLVAWNKMFPLFHHLHFLITGSDNSLDARQEAISFLKEVPGVRVTMQCAPIAQHGAPRFLAPYGGKDAQRASRDVDPAQSERASKEAGCHLSELIPETTSALFVIGQIPTDFFEGVVQMMPGQLPRLTRFSLQGPGFNTLGTSREALNAFVNAILAKPEGVVHWSTNKAGLFLTADDVKQRFSLLSHFNRDIISAQGHIIASFLFTSGKGNFTSTFGDGRGWDYGKHLGPLLDKLRPFVVARA